MPQFKLKKNDVYHNVLKTHPKYVISYYHNNVYIIVACISCCE